MNDAISSSWLHRASAHLARSLRRRPRLGRRSLGAVSPLPASLMAPFFRGLFGPGLVHDLGLAPISSSQPRQAPASCAVLRPAAFGTALRTRSFCSLGAFWT